MFVLIFISLCCLSYNIATKKGKSGFDFFCISLILTPIVGIIWALIISPNVKKIERRQIKLGISRMCYNCFEVVRREAIVCKHCSIKLINFKDIETHPDFKSQKKSKVVGGVLNLFIPGSAQIYCGQYLWGFILSMWGIILFAYYLTLINSEIETEPDFIVKLIMVIASMIITAWFGISWVNNYNKDLLNQFSEDGYWIKKNKLDQSFVVTDE